MGRKQRKHSTSVLSRPPPPKPPVKARSASSSPSMLDSLKQGFGFGAGIEMARGIIGSIFPKEEPKAYSGEDNNIISEECKPMMRSMIECMKGDDDAFCEEEIQSYKQCIKERS